MDPGPGRDPRSQPSGPKSNVIAQALGEVTVPGAGDGPGGPMRLTLLPLENDPVIRVRVQGPLSLRGAPGVDPLQELLGPKCFGHIVLLNLERVTAADTTGIAWLVRTVGRFAQAGGRVILYAVPSAVRQLFAVLGLTDGVPAADTEAEARQLAAEGAAGPAG